MTDPVTVQPIDTEALRRLADAATEGPWSYPGELLGLPCSTVFAGDPKRTHAAYVAAMGPDDGAFIAAARTAIPALLDALAAAEHRATRAEAQSEARRINAEYWKGVARGNATTADVWKETAEEAQERAEAAEGRETHHLLCIKNRMRERDEAEARIKAVRDVLAHHSYGGPDQEDAIRRALEGWGDEYPTVCNSRP